MENSNDSTQQEYLSMMVVLDNHLHAAPSVSLVKLANKYLTNHGCRIYVRKEGMEYSKSLESRAISYNNEIYYDANSIVTLLLISARKDDKLEFIALGDREHAKNALKQIETFSKTFE